MTAHPVQLDLFDPSAALSAPTSAPGAAQRALPPAPERGEPLTAQERTGDESARLVRPRRLPTLG